jgi:histidine ammonia-lyase
VSKGNRIYGINTGFGFLSDVTIPPEKLEQLQLNLIRSHACAVGDLVMNDVVRGLLILRVHTFLKLYSAVTAECVDLILGFLKFDILPCIPEKGSVGASGDLAPLSHLALALIGEGDVSFEGRRISAKEAIEHCKLQPLKPKAKEGLSLINGTHFMSVQGAFALKEAHELLETADAATALSLDALRGSTKPFDPRIHEIRPHLGQKAVAQNILSFFDGQDEILESHADCSRVQDPYSFRCAAQVHGASRDTFAFAEATINIELNSVTDNPLVFANGDVISGGNFHGQPIAFAMDFLAIAVAELGSISERRTEKLTNPNLSNLPAFIIKDSGLNSGYMIPHVVAAALVSENKILCHPASVDSIPTSADKEDHVSMGPIAARKARSICKNVAYVLAIELLAACQGIDLHKPLRPSRLLGKICDKVREMAPFLEYDRSLANEIETIAKWLLSGGMSQLLIEIRKN